MKVTETMASGTGEHTMTERDRTEYDKVQSQDDEATPVDLVYVLVGHYSVGSDDKDPIQVTNSFKIPYSRRQVKLLGRLRCVGVFTLVLWTTRLQYDSRPSREQET